MSNPVLHHSDSMSPKHLDLKKDTGLTVHWEDGTRTFYPIAYLRKMSPSADMRVLREQMAKNPLTVLPSTGSSSGNAPLTATGVEMVGNYAVRITFSDGHDTGIYSWDYLRQITPESPPRNPRNPLKPQVPERSE